MNWYEEKQERRRERLEDRAARLQREGAARIESGMDRLRATFGQPILIGHHSERRDRNYRRKAINAVDKGVELQEAGREAAAAAAAVGTGGISSDDPEAIEKLREKLAERKAAQAAMLQANKELRAKAGPKWKEARRAGLGHATWELSNNNAQIHRIEARIAHLERNANRETTEVERADGIKIIENAEINRLQIKFPGKPPAAERDILKRFGFRWSPTEGAWQRHLTGRHHAEWVLEAIDRMRAVS